MDDADNFQPVQLRSNHDDVGHFGGVSLENLRFLPKSTNLHCRIAVRCEGWLQDFLRTDWFLRMMSGILHFGFGVLPR